MHVDPLVNGSPPPMSDDNINFATALVQVRPPTTNEMHRYSCVILNSNARMIST